MTRLNKPVSRRTLSAYQISISGVVRGQGRSLVATLHGDPQTGDWLTIRESGRRVAVTLDLAGLYRRGLLAQVQADRTAKRGGRT